MTITRVTEDMFLSGTEGTPTLGAIVVWDINGLKIPLNDVRKALADNGLDPEVANDRRVVSAFRMARRELEEKDKVLRQLRRDGDNTYFQLTLEKHDNDELTYDRETTLVVDEESGSVRLANPEEIDKAHYVTKAQELIDEKMATRYGTDISVIIKKLFTLSADGDLFALTKSGGSYFVPNRHMAFVEQLTEFVKSLGGEMTRIKIPADDPRHADAAKAAVKNGIEKIIKEQYDAIASLDVDSRATTFDKVLDRINGAMFKTDSYSVYLEEQQEALKNAIEDCKKKLAEKVEQIRKEKKESEEEAEDVTSVPGSGGTGEGVAEAELP